MSKRKRKPAFTCCQHGFYVSAIVLDMKHCVCPACGIRWLELPLVDP